MASFVLAVPAQSVAEAPTVKAPAAVKQAGDAHSDVHTDAPWVKKSQGKETRAKVKRRAAAFGQFHGTAEGPRPAGSSRLPQLGAHVRPSCSDGNRKKDWYRVQALFAVEEGTKSRRAELMPKMLNDLANADDTFAASALKTGGGRRVRWVHDRRCIPMMPEVTVPAGSFESGYVATATAVIEAGYDRPDRKYVIFTGAEAACAGNKAIDSSKHGNRNDGEMPAYALIDTTCFGEAADHVIVTHEIAHTLGAVQPDAPHASVAGHCTDEFDAMCYADADDVEMREFCPEGEELLFDCNNDDYFNTRPPAGSYLATHWNMARSPFLDVVPRLTAPRTTLHLSRRRAPVGASVTATATTKGPRASYTWSFAPGCTASDSRGRRVTFTCDSFVREPAVRLTAVGRTGLSRTLAGRVSFLTGAAPSVEIAPLENAWADYAEPLEARTTGDITGYHWAVTRGQCMLRDATRPNPEVTCVAQTGKITLRLTIRTADGRAATDTMTFFLVDPPFESIPTRLTVWTDTFNAMQSGEVVLNARATRADPEGEPLLGTPRVSLWVWWDGSEDWEEVGSALTNRNGRVSLGVSMPRAGTFAWVLEESGPYEESVSPEVFVRAPTRIRGWETEQGTAGARLTVSASGEPVAGKRVWLIAKFGSLAGTAVDVAVTDADGVAVFTDTVNGPVYRVEFIGDETRAGVRSAEIPIG
ncbi:hypothetical protein GCM10027026_01170 [Myroides odoratimimus subsp. xuanwuensis]